MRLRTAPLLLLLAALCLAEGTWQTATELTGVDFQGLTGAKKDAVLKLLRAEPCSCGCSMKIAECRMKDHSCAVSRKLAGAVTKDAAAGMTTAAIRADLKKIAAEPEQVLEDPVNIALNGVPVKGPQNARVTIVEFSDFQCPYCSTAVAQVKELMRILPNDVRLAFKQFPLDMHDQAQLAAEASLAAQAQGKFWEMHDLLYAGYPAVSRARILTYAQNLKLDMTRFTGELNSHKYRARALSEEQEGEKLGVSGTPTFFINGKKYNGVFEVAKVLPLIRKELK